MSNVVNLINREAVLLLNYIEKEPSRAARLRAIQSVIDREASRAKNQSMEEVLIAMRSGK